MLASLDPNGPAAPIMLAGISSDERERSILLKDNRRYPNEIRNKTAFELLKMIDSVKVGCLLVSMMVVWLVVQFISFICFFRLSLCLFVYLFL